MRTTILYLSFNSDVYHRQTLFSILSLVNLIKGKEEKYNIVLFCDNINFYREYLGEYAIVYEEFNDKVAEKWLSEGSINKKYDAIDIKTSFKILAIKNTLLRYKNKILYVDDDTFFLKEPDTLLENIQYGSVVMYKDEGVLINENKSNWQDLINTFRTNEFVLNEEKISIPVDINMWNAGVIGLSIENVKLLDEVMKLACQLHKIGSNPNFYHDQVIFSFIFQNTKNIMPASDYIYHYCYGNEKHNFNIFLQQFFKNAANATYTELLEKVYKSTKNEISNEPPKLTLIKKVSLFFKRRKIGLNLAINRVIKTKRILSFFERGKLY